MDQEVFTKAYFKTLTTALLPYGYDPQKLIEAIWAGTSAMIKNDGKKSNKELFWDVFVSVYKIDLKISMPLFDKYYRTAFNDIKKYCGFNPDVAKALHKIHNMGLKTVLATNPIFPGEAVENRIRWSGLNVSDFEFYTSYENSSYSKPNPNYYKWIASSLNATPSECLMVGNDVSDDMTASETGMNVFLLTDCLINKDGKDISAYANGSFPELLEYIAEKANANTL